MTDRRSSFPDATITVIARRGVRGLRVQEVAAEAEVSVPLIYHYFGSRGGLLEAALAAVHERAGRYTQASADPRASARDQLTARLLGELQDTEEVRTTSSAWGELRWASVFDEGLRPPVAALTAEWVAEVAHLIDRLQVEEGVTEVDRRDPEATAEILIALVEGLSGRWLTGAAPLSRLRRLLETAMTRELPPRPRRASRPRSADARR